MWLSLVPINVVKEVKIPEWKQRCWIGISYFFYLARVTYDLVSSLFTPLWKGAIHKRLTQKDKKKSLYNYKDSKIFQNISTLRKIFLKETEIMNNFQK